jgi:hypothetical protein
MEIFIAYLALAGAAFGLLEFGVGALLWADHKAAIVVGLAAALGGLYLGLWLIFQVMNPYLG